MLLAQHKNEFPSPGAPVARSLSLQIADCNSLHIDKARTTEHNPAQALGAPASPPSPESSFSART
jgi:hypothetical protein